MGMKDTKKKGINLDVLRAIAAKYEVFSKTEKDGNLLVKMNVTPEMLEEFISFSLVDDPYSALEARRFTAPKRLSPYYDATRIPRKLKKKVKVFCWISWDGLDNGQRLWYYLGKVNPDYKRFLIGKICEIGVIC